MSTAQIADHELQFYDLGLNTLGNLCSIFHVQLHTQSSIYTVEGQTLHDKWKTCELGGNLAGQNLGFRGQCSGTQLSQSHCSFSIQVFSTPVSSSLLSPTLVNLVVVSQGSIPSRPSSPAST